MEARWTEDFDVQVERVLLAHHCVQEPGLRLEAYKGGRMSCGMICAVSGEADYSFASGRLARLRGGDVVFIPATAAYAMKVAGGVPFDHYTVNFLSEPETLGWLADEEISTICPDEFAAFRVRFDEIARVWGRKQAGYRMQARALLLALLHAFLLEGAEARRDAAARAETLPAKRYIDERFDQPITLESLAGLCCMSRTHFRRLFHAAYGVSPIAYLIGVRVEKAKDLLLMRTCTLDEISQRTGHASTSYFIRVFRKQTGMTPRQFSRLY